MNKWLVVISIGILIAAVILCFDYWNLAGHLRPTHFWAAAMYERRIQALFGVIAICILILAVNLDS